MNHFTYNGRSTRDFGLIVNNTQIYGAPSRKVEKVSVPGRNGDILLEDGGYENYIQSYDVGITDGFRVNARNIANWLLKSKQYQTLTDTFNPDEFRLASCYNSIEYIVSSLNRYGRATIQFDCKPQRYLNANDTITLAPTSTTTTDTTLSLETISTPLDITLQGNTTQNGTPTPTSPIEVVNVRGDNEVKVVEKNLLDSDLLLEASGWTKTDGVYYGSNNTLHNKWGTNTNGIFNTFIQGERYTFSFDLKQENPSIIGTLVVRFYYSDNTYDGLIFTNSTNEFTRYTLTSTSTTKTLTKLILSFGNQANIYLRNLQIEIGTSRTTYEPYKEISYPVNLGSIELNQIGSYKDYIYKSGDKWYVHKETKKVTLNGAENWALGSMFYCTNAITSTQYSINPTGGNIKSNYYVYSSGATNDPSIDIANGYIVRIKDTTKADADAFKTWLTSNNVTLYYALATATNTEITYTPLINQLNEIEKATSYDGVTNILQDNSGNPFMLEVVSLRGETLTSEYNGEPIITVNEKGLISWNGNIIKVNKAPMVINSQTMQAYYGNENLNNYLEGEFPTIDGDSEVGSTMELSVVPNWWRL